MKIRFENETFTKLLAKANAEDTNIPALVSKLVTEYLNILSEEEKYENKETTGKASTLR